MQVFNNVPAFNVWVNYAKNVANMRSSMSRLASGSRIATSADDPAGLAISERMRAQIRNSTMAAQNIQNEQAYLRTADSWMQKIHDMLHRMAELAVSANDGTKTQTDRSNLQAEFEQLQAEIARITSGSLARGKYNTKNIFDGQSHYVQIGPDPGQWFQGTALRLDRFSSQSIGSAQIQFSAGQYQLGPSVAARWSMILARGGTGAGRTGNGIEVSTLAGAAKAGAFLALAIDHLSRQRAIVGAQSSRLAHTLDGLQSYQANLRGAESQIRDVDVAFESTTFMKSQILVQVGTAMLAQANALPQNVLQLIR